MSLLPPEEEFPGQFETEQLTRSMEIQMNRIYNFVTYFDFTNTTLVIKKVSISHLIIHPLGEDGETLDVNLNDDWAATYRKKAHTKRGRNWLNKNWVLPEKAISLEKDRIAYTCAAGQKENNTPH